MSKQILDDAEVEAVLVALGRGRAFTVPEGLAAIRWAEDVKVKWALFRLIIEGQIRDVMAER